MRLATSVKGAFRAARVGLLTTAVVVGATGASLAAQEFIFYTAQTSPQFVTARGSVLFAEKVKEATGGEITVNVRMGGTLAIQANNITQAVGQNIVQMGEDVFFTGAVQIPEIIRLPGLLQNYDQLLIAHKVVLPAATKAFAERNVQVLATYGGVQFLWGRGEITSLADLKGLKIRTATPQQGVFISQMGGSSITLNVSEVPSALERGVVDGIVTGLGGGNQWKDGLKSGLLIPVNSVNAFLVMNKDVYDGLSPDLQQKIRTAALEAAEWTQTTMIEEDKGLADKLRAEGIKISEPSAEDLKMAGTLSDYWDKWAQEQGPEAVALLKELKTALGK
jgi:TRAP-type C4-dicarboxylate transport system substrate-binding protein